ELSGQPPFAVVWPGVDDLCVVVHDESAVYRADRRPCKGGASRDVARCGRAHSEIGHVELGYYVRRIERGCPVRRHASHPGDQFIHGAATRVQAAYHRCGERKSVTDLEDGTRYGAVIFGPGIGTCGRYAVQVAVESARIIGRT